MSLTFKQDVGVFVALAILMGVTRFHHFEPLPDASWAVYFAAGFYLRRHARWVLPSLLIEALLIDYIATRYMGVSSYCLTPAYWAVVPGYAALFVAGSWLGRGYRGRMLDLWRLAAALFVGTSVCYLVTNGAFYWFSGYAVDPGLAGYAQNFLRYYGDFLLVPAIYAALGVAVHGCLAQGIRILGPGKGGAEA